MQRVAHRAAVLGRERHEAIQFGGTQRAGMRTTGVAEQTVDGAGAHVEHGGPDGDADSGFASRRWTEHAEGQVLERKVCPQIAR